MTWDHPRGYDLAAPYGVYRTADGHLALAMTPLPRLATLLDFELPDDDAGFASRDAVKQVIAARLADGTNAHWKAYLRADGIWCAPVLNWEGLPESEAFDRLDMLQTIGRAGAQLETTRSPRRVDGAGPAAARGAPAVGEHDAAIRAEFGAAGPRSRR